MSISAPVPPAPHRIKSRLRSSVVVADLIAASGIALLFLDAGLFVLLDSWRDHPVVLIPRIIPDLGQASLFFMAAFLFLMAYRISSGNRHLSDKALFVINAGAASGLAADTLKIVFGRIRPGGVLPDDAYVFHWFGGTDGLDSFPSTHAAVAAALAGGLAHLWPQHRVAIFSGGIAIAACRVILGVHYLSDALFGFAIGLSMVTAMQLLFERCGIAITPNTSHTN